MRKDEQRLPGEGIPQRLFSVTYLVERRIRRHFRGSGLHWGLRRMLQQLFLQDGLSQKELSTLTGSSEASVSNMLKHLVSGGWVERRQDDYDYRISRIHLASKGSELREAILRDLRALDDKTRTRLGGSDADRLEVLLEQAAEAFREASPCEWGGGSERLADHPSPPGEL